MAAPFTDTLMPFAEYGLHCLSRMRTDRIGQPVFGFEQVLNFEVSLAALMNGGRSGS